MNELKRIIIIGIMILIVNFGYSDIPLEWESVLRCKDLDKSLLPNDGCTFKHDSSFINKIDDKIFIMGKSYTFNLYNNKTIKFEFRNLNGIKYDLEIKIFVDNKVVDTIQIDVDSGDNINVINLVKENIDFKIYYTIENKKNISWFRIVATNNSNIEELYEYEGFIDEPFNPLDEPLNPFLIAGSDSAPYLSKYIIPANALNYTNNIEVNTTFLNHKNLAKKNREVFGFIVLHDGGNIPMCNSKPPKESEECVIRNIIKGMWKIKEISSHYYIGCDGEIFKLVSEEYIAHHAGCSDKGCVLEGMNNISIGIDLRNCKHYTKDKDKPYSDKQHIALNNLLQDIKSRGLIKEINDETVVGHFEVYRYKGDPVTGFKWKAINGLTVDHKALIKAGKKTPFQLAVKKSIGFRPLG